MLRCVRFVGECNEDAEEEGDVLHDLLPSK